MTEVDASNTFTRDVTIQVAFDDTRGRRVETKLSGPNLKRFQFRESVDIVYDAQNPSFAMPAKDWSYAGS